MRLHPEQQYQQQPVTDGNQASQWQEAGAAPALENIRLYRMKKSFMRGLHFVLSPPKDTDIVLKRTIIKMKKINVLIKQKI